MVTRERAFGRAEMTKTPPLCMVVAVGVV